MTYQFVVKDLAYIDSSNCIAVPGGNAGELIHFFRSESMQTEPHLSIRAMSNR